MKKLLEFLFPGRHYAKDNYDGAERIILGLENEHQVIHLFECGHTSFPAVTGSQSPVLCALCRLSLLHFWFLDHCIKQVKRKQQKRTKRKDRQQCAWKRFFQAKIFCLEKIFEINFSKCLPLDFVWNSQRLPVG